MSDLPKTSQLVNGRDGIHIRVSLSQRDWGMRRKEEDRTRRLGISKGAGNQLYKRASQKTVQKRHNRCVLRERI